MSSSFIFFLLPLHRATQNITKLASTLSSAHRNNSWKPIGGESVSFSFQVEKETFCEFTVMECLSVSETAWPLQPQDEIPAAHSVTSSLLGNYMGGKTQHEIHREKKKKERRKKEKKKKRHQQWWEWMNKLNDKARKKENTLWPIDNKRLFEAKGQILSSVKWPSFPNLS